MVHQELDKVSDEERYESLYGSITKGLKEFASEGKPSLSEGVENFDYVMVVSEKEPSFRALFIRADGLWG
jgi:hypothetical protein